MSLSYLSARRRIGVLFLAAAVATLVMFGASRQADATGLAFTGPLVSADLSISADTAGNATSPAYTNAPFTLEVSSNGLDDIFTVTLPVGWSLDTASALAASSSGGCTITLFSSTATTVEFQPAAPCAPGSTVSVDTLPVRPDNGSTTASGVMMVTSAAGDNFGAGTLTITPGVTTHFSATAPDGSTMADQLIHEAFDVKVTALDQFNKTATGYAGSPTASYNSLFVPQVAGPFVNGVATVSLSADYLASYIWVNVDDGALHGVSSSFNVRELAAITISSTPNPSVGGSQVTVVVHIEGASTHNNPFGGTLTTSIDGVGVSTANMMFQPDGNVTLAATLSTGMHTITASYSGGSSILNGSATPYQHIAASPTAVTYSGPTAAAPGVPFIAPVQVVSVPPGGTPTGTVTVMEGATALGSATIGGSGVAIPTITLATPGTHVLTVVYAGGIGYIASTSDPATVTVSVLAPGVALTVAPAATKAGEQATFTATVSGSGAAPTGSVTFFDGATALGSGTIVSGVATFTTGSLAAGSHTITAQYGGDSFYAGAASNAGNLVVTKWATTATLTATDTTVVAPIGSVSFTGNAQRIGAGNGALTGTFTLKDGAATLDTKPFATDVTFAGAGLAVGSHTLTVVYSGDANYEGSTSAPVTVMVVPPAFGTAPPPSTPSPTATSSPTATPPARESATPPATPRVGMKTAAPAVPGQVSLVIEDGGSIRIGDRITIGAGTDHAEEATVIGLNPVRLDAPLKFAHEGAELVTVVANAAPGTPEAARPTPAAPVTGTGGGDGGTLLWIALAAAAFVAAGGIAGMALGTKRDA